jgi:hypothetical protein
MLRIALFAVVVSLGVALLSASGHSLSRARQPEVSSWASSGRPAEHYTPPPPAGAKNWATPSRPATW